MTRDSSARTAALGPQLLRCHVDLPGQPLAVGQPRQYREDVRRGAEPGRRVGEQRGRDLASVRVPSHARSTAASASVSGTGGVSGRSSSVPSTPTDGIRRGTSQGRSALAWLAMVADTAQPSR